MPDADVIVVGFRCAGAPLAYALHRAGAKVIVVDKDPFFSDQPISTHAIQPYGMKMFDRLGLGDVVRDLAPPGRAYRFQVEDSYMQVELDGTTLDARAPRRAKLDPALQKAALAAGVDARERTRVTGLVQDGDRVVGIRVQHEDRAGELRAPLVVGADGRNSTIAKMVGAPIYLESRTGNALYWSYFEQTPLFTSDPRYDWGACIHMGSEHYNNPFTRMIFRRVQNSPAMLRRMFGMMDRQILPQDMIPLPRMLGWLVAESFHGNWAPWSQLGRTLRFGRQIMRQQAVLDRALAAADRGDRDASVPILER